MTKKSFIAGLLLATSLYAGGAAAQSPQQCVTNAVAGGTSDAITVPLLPCGLATNILILTITANNTTTSPTLQMAGFPAFPILTNTLQAPGIGDFGDAGSVLMLTSTGSSWLIINGNVGGYIPLPLDVADGGTGVATITSHGLVYGNGTSPVGITAAGTTGQYLEGSTGSAPIWGTLASDAVTTITFGSTGLTPSSPEAGAVDVGGTLVVGNGGTGAATFTSHGVVLGNGSSPLSVSAEGATGTVLSGNTGSNPTFQALSGLATTSVSFGTTGLTPNSATAGAVTVAGTLGFANGGTSNSSYTNGQLLIGNTSTGGLTKSTLTAGANVTITNGPGGITIASTGLASGCGTGLAPAGYVLTSNGATACTANADATFATGALSLGTANTEAGSIKLFGATSGSIVLAPAATAGSNTITFPAGTTDFSTTGGTGQVVRQSSVGAAFTVGTLACSDLSGGCVGIAWGGIQTSNFNAAVNTRYCITTTGGAVTMTLPASPADGDQIGFIDCASNFAVNNMTVGRNAKNIMGLAANMTVSTANAAATLIYVSANSDWRLY